MGSCNAYIGIRRVSWIRDVELISNQRLAITLGRSANDVMQANGICQRQANKNANKMPSSFIIDLVVLDEKISKFVNALLLFRYLSLEEGLDLHQGMPYVKFGCN